MTNAAANLPWETWKSPYALASIDPTDQVLERSSYCLDGCRYDHANLTWEGLAANPYPYRWLFADGDEEVVFDDDGPGAITRIWMTAGNCIDPTTGVRVYMDGAATPVLDMPLAALFDGSTPPFTPPLAYAREQSSGGYVSYLPITYAQHVRIGLTNADNGYNSCTGDGYRALWFQIQYHHVPPGTFVKSFGGSDDVPALRALLGHAGNDPWEAGLAPESSSRALSPSSTVPAGQHTGAGWLRGIRLRLPRDAYAHVNLKLGFDGSNSVDMPLQDLFAVGGGAAAAARGLLVGEAVDGWLYAWFAMPFRAEAVAALSADADLPPDASADVELYWDDVPVPDDAGYFVAQLHDTCPTTPGDDFVLYADGGAGRVVGVSAVYRAYEPIGLDYLEGDERAYRDGRVSPGWYGTGVEDFFNAGFYFVLGPYARALSGATAVDLDGAGTTSAYRLLLTDFLDYASGIALRQEAGPTGQREMCSRTVAYAYRAAQPRLVLRDRLDLADPGSIAYHSYAPPPDAACGPLSALYGDEPPTPRSGSVCSFASGSSSLVLNARGLAAPLRLRRTFDAAQPGQVAEVWVDGSLAGKFPYTPSNPARRWQEQDAVLNVSPGGKDLRIEIRPKYGAPDGAATFTESRYELWGAPTDVVFQDDFDGA